MLVLFLLRKLTRTAARDHLKSVLEAAHRSARSNLEDTQIASAHPEKYEVWKGEVKQIEGIDCSWPVKLSSCQLWRRQGRRAQASPKKRFVVSVHKMYHPDMT